MVANLSAGKRGWDDKLSYFSDWAVKAQQLKDELLFLVDEDTAAFNKVMDAFGLPKESAEEKAARSAAIQSANKYAAEIPLRVMETAVKSYQLLAEMAEKGKSGFDFRCRGRSSRHRAPALKERRMNVRINLAGLKDEKVKSVLRQKKFGESRESESEFKKISDRGKQVGEADR